MKSLLSIFHRHWLTGWWMLLCVVMGTSCQRDESERAEETAQTWGTAYFNWQLSKAQQLSTPSAMPLLRWVASQLTQSDVDTLRALPEGASCEVEQLKMGQGDSTATARLTVSHYMRMDTIGKGLTLREKDTYHIDLVRKGKEWRVNLTAPLRPEEE